MNINPILLIKAIFRKIIVVLLFPVIVAAIVMYLQLQKPREYQSGMMFYTGLVSGGNLSSQGEGRTDHFAITNAFDNLITIIQSREVIEEVAMRLLATHLLLEKPDPFKVSTENWERLHKEMLPKELINELTKHNSFETTLENIRQKYRDSQTNEIIRLLNTSSTFYDLTTIRQSMTASRRGNSDMIQVIYKSNDPGVCYLTLQIIAETFINKNHDLKRFETGGIIEYFERELEKARENLNKAEETLKDYSQDNQVINYSEQTKYIAAAKEDLERDINLENAAVKAFQQAIIKLEENINSQQRLALNSASILEKRNELTRIATRISNLEILNRLQDAEEMSQLKERQKTIEADLVNRVSEHKELIYSSETLPRVNIIDQWIANVIELDKSQARVIVLESQRSYFDDLFTQFAPIGFNLSKMEREIEIAEREYLTILHGLNMARLRQSNLELFNTLELLDEPFFPLTPQGSKAKLLVIAAFLGSFFFVTGFIVAIELMDQSLKTPAIAEAKTGLEPLSASTDYTGKNTFDYDLINLKLLNLCVNKLVFQLNHLKEEQANPVILTFSTRFQENMAQNSLLIANAMHKIYGQTIYLYGNDYQAEQLKDTNNPQIEILSYGEDGAHLHDHLETITQSGKPAVIQLPEFDKQSLAEFLKLKPTLSVLMVHATQTWDYLDKKLLKSLMVSFPDIHYKLFLSGVAPDLLDDFLPEIPRKRSFIRRWVKKILKLNF